MSSIYYLRNGKVIRRVYKTIGELSQEWQDVINAAAAQGSPWSEAEAEDKIAAAQARYDKAAAAIDKAGGYSDGGARVAGLAGIPILRRREAVTWTRMGNFLHRWAGSTANTLTFGLLPALEDYENMKHSPDVTAEAIAQQEALMLTEWKAYQRRLMDEWKTYQVLDRRTEEVTGQIKQLGRLRAELQLAATPAAVKAQAVADAAAFQKAVAAAPADQKLQLVLDRLAVVEATTAQTKAELAARAEEAKAANTVTNVKASGIEALVPTTPEQVVMKAESSGWYRGIIDQLLVIKDQASSSGSKRVVSLMMTTLAKDAILWRFNASYKVKMEQRVAELRGRVTGENQSDAEEGQARQRQGAELMARIQALKGQHLQENVRQKVEHGIESWGLGTNRSGATYNSLSKLVAQMEAANTNPRSPYYKA